MKIGDRVKFIGSIPSWKSYVRMLSIMDSYTIVRCDIPNGHHNMYAIKSIVDDYTTEVWEDEIQLGDKVLHTTMGDGGFISKLFTIKKDIIPPGWQPTPTNYTPPTFQYVNMYVLNWTDRLKGCDIPCFEEFLEIDTKYYLCENRDAKIDELLK